MRMVRDKSKSSTIWTCHQAIDTFCAQRTEELVKYLDSMFADIRIEMNNVLGQ